MAQARDGPLWHCPQCGRSFANRNQSHACGRHALDDHFAGSNEEVRRIFETFRAMLQGFGPVEVLPEKTRIAFHVRMSFAQLTLRRRWVLGHLVLARRAEDGPFARIETISPRNHVHHFRLERAEEVAQLRSHAREAYAVGRQEHLG
jgi:hypothetical protein